MMRALYVTVLLALGGCQWIGDTADRWGEHMPVVGERCEHWQCITVSGQKRSDEIKAQQKQQPAPPPAPAEPSSYPAQPSKPTAQ